MTGLRKKVVFLAGAGLAPLLLYAVAAAAQGTAPAEAPHANATALFGKYCAACHSGTAPKGDVSLRFKDDAEAIAKAGDDEFWTKVATELSTGHMPPAGIASRPSGAERALLVDFIEKKVFASIKPDPGPFIVHRLNNREYANTLRDLLYLPAGYNAAADFPADERGDGFDNNAGTLTLSPLLIEQYLRAAEKAADAAFPQAHNDGTKGQDGTEAITSRLNEPGKHIKPDYVDPMPKIRVNVAAVLTRAWRRPVSEAELNAVMKFADLSVSKGGLSGAATLNLVMDRAVQLAIRAAVMSPNFLFRMERNAEADGKGAIFALNDYQLASRLSYFLWSSMPDDALFAQAKAGTLKQNLEAEVARMLKDPKGISMTKDFLGQWLEIRGLESTPNVDKALLASMRTETETFFNYIVTNDRPITDLLAADYTFVDEKLAKLYGIPGVTGSEFRKVAVDPARRGGIVTQASFLTITSKPLGDGLRTSPVMRGKFILENLFNQKLPPPPPNVPSLTLDTNKQLTGTVRQIFEQHRDFPSCAGCHARMDPYGFALENYSGTGEWRLKDNGADIDATGEIDGKKFAGPVEFRKMLSDRKDDFRRAFIRKVLSYALGRGIQGFDRPAVEAIAAAVKADGDKFSSVILNVVKSYPFQYARGSMAMAADGKPGDARAVPASVSR
jgi:mono/diheme cytochrome c family protein